MKYKLNWPTFILRSYVGWVTLTHFPKVWCSFINKAKSLYFFFTYRSLCPTFMFRSKVRSHTDSLSTRNMAKSPDHKMFVCLCWGLTSQSTIFQSCRDRATASWVINQYFWGVKCLAQGHNTAAVGLEPPTSRSVVRHSTTEPPRSPP